MRARLMRVTIALIFASLSTAVVYAETYNYSCKVCVFPTIARDDGSDGCEEVGGKTYPLRIDDAKNVLEWRVKKYKLTNIMDSDEPSRCGRGGWHAEGNGTSFTFCYATQGYGAIEDKDGTVRVRCNLQRR
jgi:hypothetical protein